MKSSEVLLHKLADAEMERLCCRHNFIKQEAAAEDTVQGATNTRNEVPAHELEFTAVKEEPSDLPQKPQASTSGVSSTLTFKKEAEEVCAGARAGLADTEHQTREGSSVEVPSPEKAPAGTNTRNEGPARGLEFITVKEEPSDWSQEPQACADVASSALIPKREADEVCAEARSGHPAEERTLSEGTSDACNASTIHQRSPGGSQGSADLVPSDFSGGRSSPDCNINKFKCQSCGYSFSERKLLTRHRVLEHSLEKRFKCELCNFSSFYKRHRNEHQACKHGKGKLFECEFCDYSSAFATAFKRHQASKHGIGKLFQCEFCIFSSAYSSVLKLHQARKHGKGKILECEFCDYSSAFATAFKRHQASKHSMGKMFKCELCDYSSAYGYYIKIHQASKHGKGKLVKCDFCDYLSASIYAVKQHQASKHGKGKLFKCEFCDYSSANSGHVKRHQTRKHRTLS